MTLLPAKKRQDILKKRLLLLACCHNPLANKSQRADNGGEGWLWLLQVLGGGDL